MSPDHLINRDLVLQEIRKELVGPAPSGQEIDCTKPLSFDNASDARGPWRQMGSGEEILHRDPPTKRYGVGVLYPSTARAELEREQIIADTALAGAGLLAQATTDELAQIPGASNSEQNAIQELAVSLATAPARGEPHELDLSGTSSYRPSTIGVSFLARIPEDSILRIEASGGRYTAFEVMIQGQERPRTWWLRTPVRLHAEVTAETLTETRSVRVSVSTSACENTEGVDIRIEVFSRPAPNSNDPQTRLLTVCLVNRSQVLSGIDEACLFQAWFRATVTSSEGQAYRCILPYPTPSLERLDPEERALALLYRHAQTFAIGHGCAANWDVEVSGNTATWVSAECLPAIETPSITPDITREDGTPIQVSMRVLAGLDGKQDGLSILEEVIDQYERWISRKEAEASNLSQEYRDIAADHLERCRACVGRMRKGLDYLRSVPAALRAFQLANYAVLLQQIHSQLPYRSLTFSQAGTSLEYQVQYVEPSIMDPQNVRGTWRAFQIAFLLMAIESSSEPYSAERDIVELLWFPTGGGKTEAYLGLAAFSLFMRRLRDRTDIGVHVLTRYTLRLLTTQQFQRTSALVCAMEYLRRRNSAELGAEPFSIGIWVGAANTPNTRQQALETLRALQKRESDAENPFAITRCPWCGSQMGPLPRTPKKGQVALSVVGYTQQANTVVFQCPDSSCEFSSGLPIYVIDEDIYEVRPSIIIGTVDKFAMLAWQPRARSLFGIDPDGTRKNSPPGLIIQDELHLISGPLGSMVGLYETVIEDLCTDYRPAIPVVPKTISSTATIRRFAEQVKGLYARERVVLFPPPGLDASDSFFARYATNPDGSRAPGRLYVGIYGPGLGSLQTVQVRIFTASLQSPMLLPQDGRDPWWTLLIFFNSLRELGTTLSLFQSDIPDYQKVWLNRTSGSYSIARKFWNIVELTGRATSSEVPRAIEALQTPVGASHAQPVDVCLSSSILEVGVDIDRLSLISVVGQPKTTSQYIQVTGRVGRRWWERPGLVLTIYAFSKPRDRSHYEKFRSYHERLYAQVEPTSVTPFSASALDRALHAIMVAYTRQYGDQQLVSSPYPYPADYLEQLKEIVLRRVRIVDPAEVPNVEKVFARRSAEWNKWQRTQWEASFSEQEDFLIYVAGNYVEPLQAQLSWAVPSSMRTVDAECLAKISLQYALRGGQDG